MRETVDLQLKSGRQWTYTSCQGDSGLIARIRVTVDLYLISGRLDLGLQLISGRTVDLGLQFISGRQWTSSGGHPPLR